VAAEYFEVSGVIATVSAGMLCGNYAARHLRAGELSRALRQVLLAERRQATDQRQ
jgi:NhaP-type Na+/H+ or K+/H+ antiporter